jgi:hypothetical protein
MKVNKILLTDNGGPVKKEGSIMPKAPSNVIAK